MVTGMKRQNKKIVFYLVVGLLLSLGSCVESRAAAKVLIGKVDLKALVLLHPGMRSYNPYLQAFRVDPAKVSTSVANQKSEEQHREIDELNARIRLLEGRLHETRRNYNREMERIAKQYLDKIDTLATGPRALKRKEYDIAQNRTDASFNAKLQSYSAQLEQAEDRRSKLEKVAYHVGYTDPETTQKQFAAIINEIRQYTRQIAANKGIEVVLNSKSRELKATLQAQSQVLAPDLNYDKLFAIPFPNEIRNDSAAINGYYQNITSLAANWLGHGTSILEPFSTQMLDNDIFIGGVDLTVEVLAAIFRSYKIDNNIGNAVIQSIYSN